MMLLRAPGFLLRFVSSAILRYQALCSATYFLLSPQAKRGPELVSLPLNGQKELPLSM
jgi:hypothetical protein